jgi:glycosyltransferase involved in cell wall biosynthesis
MSTRSPIVVIDPLAFELRAVGGVSRVWSILLPRLLETGLDVRFTGSVKGPELVRAGTVDAIQRFQPSRSIPATIRRFIPYLGKADLFFPTYFRPCIPGTRNIQLIHDCTKELFYPMAKAGLARIRRRNLYRNADCLISVSETTRLDVYRLYGAKLGDRVRVIHNPVDFDYLTRCVESEDESVKFSQWLRTIGSRPFCLYIGYRAGVKNFREARHLMSGLPDHIVIVVGAPPTPAEQQFSDEFGGRIVYTGPCSDNLMFKLLKRSDFLFFPSLVEGFGLPVIESLYLGTPVVALDTQINREVSLGLITKYECGSATSLRDAVNRLNRVSPDDPKRKALIDMYDPEKVCERYRQTILAFC